MSTNVPVPLAFPVPRAVDLDREHFEDGDDTAVRAAEHLTGRVEFGGPVSMPIDRNYHPEDVELQTYLEAKDGSLRFVLVIMSVNFPYGEPDLVTAEVKVELSDSGETGQTLAYSLYPTELSNAKDANRSVTIKPDLTIAGVGVSGGELDRGSVEHGTVSYVIGGPELSARPSWSFRKTPTQAIDKPARLGMVIQVPVGCTGSLTVTLGAAIDKHTLFSKKHIRLDHASDETPSAITF